MAGLLNQLRMDHINYSRLLNLLEVDITAVEAGDKVDYLRMKDIMKYMINYPDAFHHPLEEILFDKLDDLDRDEMETLEQLRGEHKLLGELGGKLAELLENATAGGIVSRDEILKSAIEYREIMRSHLATEEREIFPLIEATLKPVDWEDALAKTGNVHDPVFGEAVAEEYRRLFEDITRKERNDSAAAGER